MTEKEIAVSDVYLSDNVVFEKRKNYLIKASSGRGKTSILNSIYGNTTSYEGSILYEGEDVKKCFFELRKNKIAYVFQDFKLFEELSVIENIELKNNLTNFKTKIEIQELLKIVGLEDKENALVKNLSIGQKQRVAIVRGLCQPKELLLMDEPFSHLDKENVLILTKLITKESLDNNFGIIMTSLGEEYFFTYHKIFNL